MAKIPSKNLSSKYMMEEKKWAKQAITEISDYVLI